MTEPDVARERAELKLKSEGKKYVDISERPVWCRGWDAGFAAARLLLAAYESTQQTHEEEQCE